MAYSIIFPKKHVLQFIDSLPPKHQRQIYTKIFALLDNPCPSDARDLKGYAFLKRCDNGEYRIIYQVDESAQTVTVFLVGNRNDDKIYRQVKRIFS